MSALPQKYNDFAVPPQVVQSFFESEPQLGHLLVLYFASGRSPRWHLLTVCEEIVNDLFMVAAAMALAVPPALTGPFTELCPCLPQPN